MHTPDGLLTSWVCAFSWVFVIGALGYAARSLKRDITGKATQFAIATAVVFGLQMLNFPIAGGTSGHLIGAALLAILFGLAASMVGMTIVVTLQSLVFADGGIAVLGSNLLAMAIIAPLSAYAVYHACKRYGHTVAMLTASISSVIAAAALLSVLLGISGTAPLLTVLGAMVLWHLLVGAGEAAITTVALPIFTKTENIWKSAAIASLIIAIALPFASGAPDALEQVTINLGFHSSAITLWEGILPNYTLLGASTYLATLAVALIGMAMSAGVAGLTAITTRRMQG